MFGKSSPDNDRARCQSCGIPIHVGNFGTNASGSMNFQYCNRCFQKGAFTDADMTCARMVQITTANLMHDFGMNETEAHNTAKVIVPNAKRWKQRF
jgi:hypothetical protein